MNELQIIDQREILGTSLTVYGTPDAPLFLAKDVAAWIGHTNVTEMTRTIDESEKLNSTILSAGQTREVTMLTEDGLYEVLMQSRKPIAKDFKREVKQVLKDIRRHGLYATPATVETMLADPDAMIAALQALKAERERSQALAATVKANIPKVLFADSLAASDTSVLVSVLAKLIRQNGIDIGQNRLFEWLRVNGCLMKQGDSWNMPTQRSMEAGWFEVKERTINNPDGSIRITKTVLVTGKGQVYFVNKLRAQPQSA